MSYDPDNIDQINPGYLSAYGLTEPPFSHKQDDRYFYASPELAEQLELLRHYIQYGNLLLMVIGENGIGKTTLKNHIIHTAPEEWQLCDIPAHTMMDASLLLRQVANGFGITSPPLEASALFEVLSAQLQHFHEQGQVPILLVDDAHLLPSEALQSLFYLAEHHASQESALRIMLFCEPVINTMLEDPAIHSLKERITHHIELTPLDEVETSEYLRHRLAVAGLDGTSPFTPKLIHKIYRAANGIPAKINDYAHQNLLDDSEPPLPVDDDIDNELIHEESHFTPRNMILGGIGLVVIIFVLLFQDKINQLFEEPTTANVSRPAPVPRPATPAPAEPATVQEQVAETHKTIEFSLEKNTEAKPRQTAAKPAPVIILTAVSPNPVTASPQRQIISLSGKGFHKGQKVKLQWRDKEKILDDRQVNISSDHFMNLIISVGTQADTWQVTVFDPESKVQSNRISFRVESRTAAETTPQPATKVVKVKPASKVTAKKATGIDWVKQQPANNFTLQLLATRNKSSLPSYVKKYQLSDSAVIFPVKKDNNDWYYLIYGSYPDKSAAQKAVASLPGKISKPWIRNFAGIQKMLATSATKKASSKPTSILQGKPATADAEGWLWSQDPRYFTLQLAAGTDKKAIEAFIRQHKLTGKAVYFHRVRDGRDWYILVYGSFPDRSSAKKAIEKLPAALQKSKPWPRQFSAIHAELN